MKTPDYHEVKKEKEAGNVRSVSVFEDLEIAQRTQKPPTEDLIERLNHLVTKPPFCWTSKYKDHLPRL